MDIVEFVVDLCDFYFYFYFCTMFFHPSWIYIFFHIASTATAAAVSHLPS